MREKLTPKQRKAPRPVKDDRNNRRHQLEHAARMRDAGYQELNLWVHKQDMLRRTSIEKRLGMIFSNHYERFSFTITLALKHLDKEDAKKLKDELETQQAAERRNRQQLLEPAEPEKPKSWFHKAWKKLTRK